MSDRMPPELIELADRVGRFMHYWGFSKIDGKIWTHLYLSATPLSSTTLKARLKCSKALLSLSLNELLRYGVIRVAATAKHGTSLYESVPNLTEVIENVLRSREQQMLADIIASAKLLEKRAKLSEFSNLVSSTKATQLREMCESSETLLANIVLSSHLIASISHFNSQKTEAIT